MAGQAVPVYRYHIVGSKKTHAHHLNNMAVSLFSTKRIIPQPQYPNPDPNLHLQGPCEVCFQLP